jgi:RimJ/RimL family protein N-acetyltransferase
MTEPARDGVLLTRLRPPRAEDAALLAAWRAAPASPFDDWSGPEPPGVGSDVHLLPPHGGGSLVVTDAEDHPIGTVSWRPVQYGPNLGSQAQDIGIALRPESRGQGHGARAQRMLAQYLFATTPVHRVQATTDLDNVAEQHALERAGFRREGVLREAQWRLGDWHDLVSYARLRQDT